MLHLIRVGDYFALFFTSIWSSIFQVTCIFILDANDIKLQVIRVSVFRYVTAEILSTLLVYWDKNKENLLWGGYYVTKIRRIKLCNQIWLPPPRSFVPEIVQKKSGFFSCSCMIQNGSFWSRIWQINDILFFFLNFARRLKVLFICQILDQKLPKANHTTTRKTALFFWKKYVAPF